MSSKHSIWTGFYKKSLLERQNQLVIAFPKLLTENDEANNQIFSGLDQRIADNMIENCIGTIGIPLGLALHFIIDKNPMVIPMAIEEPSVIAAVSGAAKTISMHSLDNGFITESAERNSIQAQILYEDSNDQIHRILDEKQKWINEANRFCQSMHARGGGVYDIEIRALNSTCIKLVAIHVHINVCESMGANCATSVAEGLGLILEKEFNGKLGPRIVSNLSPTRISTSTFRIPISSLSYKGYTGIEVAERIIQASEWAKIDIYRAATHNKGIMNGIDAVAIATGQDWRAIEAACHSWATMDNNYQALTKYYIKDEILYGMLQLPLCVGTHGGIVKTNPVCAQALSILGNPNSKSLASIMVCVGLAQNFAALRAIVTEGIQKGHMALHARNIAISAGAKGCLIAECVSYMTEKNRINECAAYEYIQSHEIQQRLSVKSSTGELIFKPSMLYFEHKDISINIVFETIDLSVNIEMVLDTLWISKLIKKHNFQKNVEDNIQVGLCCLLSLIHVFEFRVKETVDNELLKTNLLSHQRDVIIAMASSVSLGPDNHQNLIDLIELHSKRFQVCIFIFCDAISFDTHLITKERVNFLEKLARHLEWEQTIAHDLGRIDRDLQQYSKFDISPDCKIGKGVINSFIYWMHYIQGMSRDSIINHKLNPELRIEFQKFISKSEETFEPADALDSQHYRNTIELYLQYYNIK